MYIVVKFLTAPIRASWEKFQSIIKENECTTTEYNKS